MAFDYKKEYKEFYAPKPGPRLIDVPMMRFLAVEGRGDPNDAQGEYSQALQALYSLMYTIKMSKMGSHRIDGYEDFVVPPLEGLWWIPGLKGMDYARKADFHWISMIRLPDFAGAKTVAWAKEEVQKKKDIDASALHIFEYDEGLCVQCLHLGPYDDEPATLEKMTDYMRKEGCESDFAPPRQHHEIYLSDPRKTQPDRLKTIIRHPVRKTGKGE